MSYESAAKDARRSSLRLCSVPFCVEPRVAKGYCKTHYYRDKKYGHPLGGREKHPNVCSVEGCVIPSMTRGFCNAHYRKYLRYGDPLIGRPVLLTACIEDGCEGVVIAKGLCSKHYYKRRRSGALIPGDASYARSVARMARDVDARLGDVDDSA